MNRLGLLIVGDYALATGEDRHLSAVSRALAADSAALEFATLVPADPVAIAAALHDALQRPHPVACFGGFGQQSDDFVCASMEALQQGRAEVGLPPWPEATVAGVRQVGSVALLPGQPARAHGKFLAWWQVVRGTLAESTLPSEHVPWSLPATPRADAARRALRIEHPLVRQRLVPDAQGGVRLQLTGPSRGKTEAARKALQRLLAAR
ncbi:MAG: hypothetical protein JNL19_12545 [Burkholderiales bacterium]|nr:hypothetical protein [Burkholderiales bacterium]